MTSIKPDDGRWLVGQRSDERSFQVAALPRSWSREEVMDVFITGPKIDSLIKAGRVGYILGKNRKRRFMAEHIGQIREALEVKPTVPPVLSYEQWRAVGVTERSARLRANQFR